MCFSRFTRWYRKSNISPKISEEGGEEKLKRGTAFMVHHIPSPTPSPPATLSSPKVKVPIKDLNYVHMEKVITESGNVIFVCWADKTLRNFFERMAFSEVGER